MNLQVLDHQINFRTLHEEIVELPVDLYSRIGIEAFYQFSIL
jgi:hypothetical protein